MKLLKLNYTTAIGSKNFQGSEYVSWDQVCSVRQKARINAKLEQDGWDYIVTLKNGVERYIQQYEYHKLLKLAEVVELIPPS